MSTTILELEEDRNYTLIADQISDLAAGSIYPATFTALINKEYDEVMDLILITRYGDYIIRDQKLESVLSTTFADLTIKSFLQEKARYITQCLEYEAAEYNPIENYAQSESESIAFSKGAQTDSLSSSTNTSSETSASSEETISNGARTTTTTIGERESTTQTAPFESSSFYNKDKTTSEEATDNTGISASTDTTESSNTSEATGSVSRTDSNVSGARRDTTTRTLERSGNIGVQTAAQMMKLDQDFWKNATWIRELMRELIELLCVEVIAV